MYQLTEQTDKTRTYRSTITGTEVSTHLLYTDGDGKPWWAFDDLLNIPFIRKKASEQVTRLYGAGLAIEDLRTFFANHKTTLKSSDPEKYEKAYAEVLELERLTEQIADPVKQSLGLCTVYILHDDEKIDTWNPKNAVEKINTWAVDQDAQSFFLNWLTAGMNDYSKSYKELSEIASALP
jgi:hypothetical protein